MADLRGEIIPFLQEFKDSINKLTLFLENSEHSSDTLTRCIAREDLGELIKLARNRLEQFKTVPGVDKISTEIQELVHMTEDAVVLVKEFDVLCGFELNLSGPLTHTTHMEKKRQRDEVDTVDIRRHKKFESKQKVNDHKILSNGLEELGHFLSAWIDYMGDYSKHLEILLKDKNYDSICHMRVSLESDLVSMSNLMRTNEDMLKRARSIYGNPRLLVRGGFDLVEPTQHMFTLMKDTTSKMSKLVNMIDETTFVLEEWHLDARYNCSNASPPPLVAFGSAKAPKAGKAPPPPSYDISEIPDLSSIHELKHVSNSRKKSVTENDLKQKLLEMRLKDILDDDKTKKNEVVSKINTYNTNLAVIKGIEGKIEQKMKEISEQSKAVKAIISKKQPIIGDRKNRMSTEQILETMEGLENFTGDQERLEIAKSTAAVSPRNLKEVAALHKSIGELKELRALYKTADDTVDEMMEDMLDSL